MGLLDTLGSVLTPQSPDTLNALYDNDPAKLKDIQNKALMSQGFNTLLSYFAQPKNQRYGSFIPYLAKAVGSGNEAAQNVYTNATQDYITGQKIADLKTANANKLSINNAIANYDPNNQSKWLQDNFKYLPQETQMQILSRQPRIEDFGGAKQNYDVFGNPIGKPIAKVPTQAEQLALTKFKESENPFGSIQQKLPPARTFNINGANLNAQLDTTRNKYFVIQNGKKFWVEE
jgi:hypothetical protein